MESAPPTKEALGLPRDSAEDERHTSVLVGVLDDEPSVSHHHQGEGRLCKARDTVDVARDVGQDVVVSPVTGLLLAEMEGTSMTLASDVGSLRSRRMGDANSRQ